MSEPLTLAQVKVNLRIDVESTDEDALIDSYILAARVHVENVTGLVLTPRIVTETARRLDQWIDLASWPVLGISAIRYPVAGVLTSLSVGSWSFSLARRPVRVLPASVGWGVGSAWSSAPTLPIEIDVMAGYATPANVPQTIKQAMHLLIAHWYGNRAAAEVGARAAAVEIPFGVTALLDPYRLRTI